jgi:hypothetical protein
MSITRTALTNYRRNQLKQSFFETQTKKHSALTKECLLNGTIFGTCLSYPIAAYLLLGEGQTNPVILLTPIALGIYAARKLANAVSYLVLKENTNPSDDELIEHDQKSRKRYR